MIKLPLNLELPTPLAAEVWVHRHGWACPLAAVLAFSAGVYFMTKVEPAHRDLQSVERQVGLTMTPSSSSLQSPALAATAPTATAEPGAALRTLLSGAEGSPSTVRQLVRIASRHGIELTRAQYSTARQSPTGIESTEITFHFGASYPATRAFIEDLLRALPHASIDRLAFERAQTQEFALEVTLRVSLWRWPTAKKTDSR